ncbi:MAG: AMP-binding protein, partial [Anaerolineae bacterium]|nr:AMP-binding protein [Anaerolineae bacterium]
MIIDPTIEAQMARGNSETYKFQTIDPMTTLYQRFEAQVNRTPGAVAVVYPSPDDELSRQELTYHQLNTRANQLAHYLRQWGVGPDVPVAICLERSVDMVVAILAVLKAGGAYVPLDLAYPKERLAFILADAQTPVLITHTTLLKKLPDYNGHKIYLDTVSDTLAQLPADNPAGNVTPTNLAYIIYTSGSTGQPKGVVLGHRGLTNYVWWAWGQYTEGQAFA